MAVAVDHHHGFKSFIQTQKCKLQSFTLSDYTSIEFNQIKLDRSLKQAAIAANIHRSSSTPCLSITSKEEDEAHTGPRVEIVGGLRAPCVHALVVEAAIALASGIDPVPVLTGLGGAYFLRNRNGINIAVAKPIDEEPLAMNNPKGFAGNILGQSALKHSVRVGETAVREVAAYLLDHGGFAGVPPTALVKISHVAFHVNNSPSMTPPSLPKIASLQRFVDHDSDAGDLGPSGFSVSSVHRIGILDIRLLNLDRHAGNILVKRHGSLNYKNDHGGYDGYVNDSYVARAAELVPIDHGLCLPELLDDPYFEWLHWPQASVPFSESEAAYISRLDPFKEAELLRTEFNSLRESSIRILVLCTNFLKRATEAGLCLADIGDMMTREFCGREERQSVLETLCIIAQASMNNVFEDNQNKEENGEEINMFQFDAECENNCNSDLDLPLLLQTRPKITKPPKVPIKIVPKRSMSMIPQEISLPLNEECKDEIKNNHEIHDNNEEESNASDDDHKVGGRLTKSVSFSVSHDNHESEGISFKDMNEEEWESFLQSFEKLLPQAFEGRKSMGMKLRLVTSCKF